MDTSLFKKTIGGVAQVEPALTPPPINSTQTTFTKKPKLGSGKSRTKKRDIPEGLWTKCPSCETMIFDKELDGLGVMDFRFLGGSMGSVVGEKLTRLIERATEGHWPVIIISTSGGARMQEGCLSLMQMAKTSAALAYHAQGRLPYISFLTNNSYGGVMASYAALGDLILGEPGAMIGFAGPRVIKDTTHADLPPGFQTTEFLVEHGLIDAIVPRNEAKERLISYLDYFASGKKAS
jgi:acetyl-CoA carboxylase beta subunit